MDITTIKESHHSLFNELMNSSGEHGSSAESSPSERRRVALQRQRVVEERPFFLNVPKAFSNALVSGPQLPEQVATYNRKHSKQFHIRLQENVSLQNGLHHVIKIIGSLICALWFGLCTNSWLAKTVVVAYIYNIICSVHSHYPNSNYYIQKVVAQVK